MRYRLQSVGERRRILSGRVLLTLRMLISADLYSLSQLYKQSTQQTHHDNHNF